MTPIEAAIPPIGPSAIEANPATALLLKVPSSMLVVFVKSSTEAVFQSTLEASSSFSSAALSYESDLLLSSPGASTVIGVA